MLFAFAFVADCTLDVGLIVGEPEGGSRPRGADLANQLVDAVVFQTVPVRPRECKFCGVSPFKPATETSI